MAPGQPYMQDHYYLMFPISYRWLTFSRTPIDPDPDFLTGIRNEASTGLHWFSILGGKATTAPCTERLNDSFELKVYNPADEKRELLIKAGIIFGLGGLFGLLIGRWYGGHLERKEQEERRKHEGYWSDSSSRLKRRHARDWSLC